MGWVAKNTPITLRTGHFYQGREIALHNKSGTPTKQPHHNTHWWPEDKKIEAATLWAVTRNVEKVHQITTIPRYAIKKWMNEPWWDNVVGQVRKEQNELLDIKLTEVIGTAVEVISDRLINGEVYVDRKSKETYRVPVNVKNASLALETTFKERQLIRGEATTRTESTTQDEKLKKLKDQFEKLAQSKLINPNVEVIEHEPVQGTGEGEETFTEAEDWTEVPLEDSPSESSGDEVEVTELTISRS